MFSGKAETKILDWRDFRNNLVSWPDDINTVTKMWAKAPLSNHYLSFDNVETWPDAWTLIKDGVYCDISVALGMFYTLYYSSYEHKTQMELHHYHFPHEHRTLNLVSLEQGKYMLNYQLGEAVNITLPKAKFIITAKDLPIKI
jgi:hypothetical protein